MNCLKTARMGLSVKNATRLQRNFRSLHPLCQELHSNLRNQLAESRSPYLLSHSHNPVAWQQWGSEALDTAIALNRPIFLSIGYHTCHWCHVMNHEYFEDPQIAALLNENFVPIKVDREERPDLDAVYSMYLQVLKGASGWPLNVFLAPGSKAPFFAGTYFENFAAVLEAIDKAWKTRPEQCTASGEEAISTLSKLLAEKNEASISDKLLKAAPEVAANYFAERFDKFNGGFGSAPKFPTPHILSFLLRYRPQESNLALITLQKMAAGGIKDQIGNGFFRYSVTADWTLPHFEKMLYDQAQLLHAIVDLHYRYDGGYSAGDSMLDLISMLEQLENSDGGGFFSAVDADSLDAEGKLSEGAFYVWTAPEFNKAVDNRMDADIAAEYFEVQEYGNVGEEIPYCNVLATSDAKKVAATFGISEKQVLASAKSAASKLRAYREKNKAPPAVDTKIITSWNGLAIGALARASRAISHEKRQETLALAERAAAFVNSKLYSDGKLMRVWYNGTVSDVPAMNEDYSFLISGVLDLYETTFKAEYLKWAKELQDIQISLLWDSKNGGFFFSESSPLFQYKEGFDGALPSANSVATSNLLRLSSMLSEGSYQEKARKILECYSADIEAQPWSYASTLGNVLAAQHGMDSYVFLGKLPSGIEYMPNTTYVHVDEESVTKLSELLGPLKDMYEGAKGVSKTIICKDGACAEQITS